MAVRNDYSSARLKKRALDFLYHKGFSAVLDIDIQSRNSFATIFAFRDGENQFLLKTYLPSPIQNHDAFLSEKNFIQCSFGHGVPHLPEPIEWDNEQRMALFKIPEVGLISNSEINLALVSKALAFLMSLNRIRPMMAGRGIRSSMNACLSIEDHINAINKLIVKLEKGADASSLRKATLSFIKDELEPSWQILRQLLTENVQRAGIPLDSRLSFSERCINPGNFGFQNAMMTKNGNLVFLNFEQAGWDDPAQTICDFFSQPQTNVPLAYWPAFVEGFTRSLGQGRSLIQRSRLLLPAIRLKWCCRVLSSCDPIISSINGLKTSPKQRLAKAKALFESISRLESCFFHASNDINALT